MVEVHRDPGPDDYATRLEVARGGRLSPQAFPELEFPVLDVLG